jgi:hypothetical protein
MIKTYLIRNKTLLNKGNNKTFIGSGLKRHHKNNLEMINYSRMGGGGDLLINNNGLSGLSGTGIKRKKKAIKFDF